MKKLSSVNHVPPFRSPFQPSRTLLGRHDESQARHIFISIQLHGKIENRHSAEG